MDEVQVRACATGLKILTCSETGRWLGDPDTCYTNFCAAEGKWPFTVPGTLQSASCPTGYEGSMTRYCSASGVWGEVDESRCVKQVCPAEEAWPDTPRNTVATIACPANSYGEQHRECLGYNGTMSRACSAAGEWQEIDRSECGTCSEDR